MHTPVCSYAPRETLILSLARALYNVTAIPFIAVFRGARYSRQRKISGNDFCPPPPPRLHLNARFVTAKVAISRD